MPFSAIQNVLPFVPNPALSRNIYWLHWATNGLVVFNDYKGHWPEFAAKTLIVPPAELGEQFDEFCRTIVAADFEVGTPDPKPPPHSRPAATAPDSSARSDGGADLSHGACSCGAWL